MLESRQIEMPCLKNVENQNGKRTERESRKEHPGGRNWSEGHSSLNTGWERTLAKQAIAHGLGTYS